MTADGRYDKMDRDFFIAAATQADITRASPARVYDFLLGGSCNFAADRTAAEAIIALSPDAPMVASANRAFLRRAVRYLTGQGIRQFLDIGSGLPTVGNVHEVAQRASPDVGVVYVDIDPIAVAHSQDLLKHNDRAIAIPADLRRSDELLDRLTDPRVRQVIDLDRPVALLLVAVLHFIPDEDGPVGLVARLRDALAPGSAVVVSHLASESFAAANVEAVQKIYRRGGAPPPIARTREQVREFFGGWRLVEPGLVYVGEWRVDEEGLPEGEDPRRSGVHAGVAFNDVAVV
jgi:hypothetical protein